MMIGIKTKWQVYGLHSEGELRARMLRIAEGIGGRAHDCQESGPARLVNNEWVMACPDLICPILGGGIAATMAVNQGDGYGYCGQCGAIVKVQWPKEEDTERAMKLLLPRPPANRNWHPEEETIEALEAENLAHMVEITRFQQWMKERR